MDKVSSITPLSCPATCRLTPYNLRKLLKDASKSVEKNGQKHQTISKQAMALLDKID
jgi:hypothetical protein